MTGKKTRPRTEPLYSGQNRNNFPISHGYDSVEYADFVNCHLLNSENLVISQSFHNGHLSCIFASSKTYSPRPAVFSAIRNDYDSFYELAKKNWYRRDGKSKQIYSLACDEKLGFGVLFMENYGTKQVILRRTSDVERKKKEGFKITSCAAWGSIFYIIMTKDTKEYQGKQELFTLNSWDDAKKVIQEKMVNGSIVTGICYSTGQYLVVVTETSFHQVYRKFRRVADLDKWVAEESTLGFHPTIIFKDPTDQKTLVVMIKDENIPRYTCKYDCKVVR